MKVVATSYEGKMKDGVMELEDIGIQASHEDSELSPHVLEGMKQKKKKLKLKVKSKRRS